MKRLKFPPMFSSGTPRGVQLYTSGSGTFVVPAGVTSICVLCIGGGAGTDSNVNLLGAQGGAGGSLCYKNNIAVTPGASYSYGVGGGAAAGGSGGTSSFSGTGASLSAGGGVLGSRGGAVSGGDVNNFGIVARFTAAAGTVVYMGVGGGNSSTASETRTASVAATGGSNNGPITINGVFYPDGGYVQSFSSYIFPYGVGGSIFVGAGVPLTGGGNGGLVRIIWGSGLSYPNNITP